MSYHALQHINDGMSKKQYGAEAGVGMGIRVAEYHLNKNNNVNSASACLAKAATYGRDGPGEDGFADAGFLDANASNSKGKYGVRINKNIDSSFIMNIIVLGYCKCWSQSSWCSSCRKGHSGNRYKSFTVRLIEIWEYNKKKFFRGTGSTNGRSSITGF